MARLTQIDLNSPDPTDAINAFFWNMNKARELGFTPPNKWVIAEHFLRGDVSLVFYSGHGGTIVMGADEAALDYKESWEFVLKLIARLTELRKAKCAAETLATEAAVPSPSDESRTMPVMPRQRGGLTRAAQKQSERTGT